MCEFVFEKCTTVGSGPTGLLQEELLSWKFANNPLFPDENEHKGPNTVDSSCADGDSGEYSNSECVQSITVESVGGGNLKRFGLVTITALVNAYDDADIVDFYLSENPGKSTTWTRIGTKSPASKGKNIPLSIDNVQLGGAETQAVRVVMRWSPETPNPLECPTSDEGLFSDTDDLAFKVDITSSGGTLGLAQLDPVDSVETLPLPAPRDCSTLPPDRCLARICPNGCNST